MIKRLIRIAAVIGIIAATILPVLKVAADSAPDGFVNNSVSGNQLILSPYLTNNGGSAAICTVVYSSSLAALYTPSSVYTGYNSDYSPWANTDFTVILTAGVDFPSGTMIYYQAAISNANWQTIGSVGSAQMPDSGGGGGGGGGGTPTVPSVYGSAATSVSSTSAIINGVISDDGMSACTASFGYDTTSHASYADYANHVTVTGSYTTGQGYSYTLTGLTASTRYYFMTRATNSTGTSNQSAEFYFDTSAPASTSVSIGAASSVAGTTATLNGTINSETSLLSIEWAYGTTSQSTFTAYDHVDGSYTGSLNTGAVTKNITSLTASTHYYFRFRVKDTSNVVTTSGEGNFYTTGGVIVSIANLTNLASTTATLNGLINSDGGYPAGVSIKFAYGTTSQTSATFASYDHVDANFTGTYSTNSVLTKNITSLTAGTLYYYMIAAQNAYGTTYSTQGNFVTLSLPTISFVAASNVSKTTARLNSSLTNSGGALCTVTFGYGATTQTAVNFNSYTTKTAVSGTFNSGTNPYLDITGLTANTAYYFRVKATNSVGDTVSTSEGTFTTALDVNAPSNIVGIPTATTAQLTWTIGAGSTGYMVRVSTSAYPTSTTAGTLVYQGIGASFTATGLTAGTSYYYSIWGYSGATYSSTYATKLVTTSGGSTATSAGGDSTSPNAPVTLGDIPRFLAAPNYGALSGIPVLYPAINGIADTLGWAREIVWALLALATIGMAWAAVFFSNGGGNHALAAFGAALVVGLIWFFLEILPPVYLLGYVLAAIPIIKLGGDNREG